MLGQIAELLLVRHHQGGQLGVVLDQERGVLRPDQPGHTGQVGGALVGGQGGHADAFWGSLEHPEEGRVPPGSSPSAWLTPSTTAPSSGSGVG